MVARASRASTPEGEAAAAAGAVAAGAVAAGAVAAGAAAAEAATPSSDEDENDLRQISFPQVNKIKTEDLDKYYSQQSMINKGAITLTVNDDHQKDGLIFEAWILSIERADILGLLILAIR